MRVAIGADHGGFQLKRELLERLKNSFDVYDTGAYEFTPDDDYPDFAMIVAHEVVSGNAERGVLICGSGVGASIAANKFPGIRAAVCHDTYSAHQGVEHDAMNVLCLGARIIGIELAYEIAAAFFKANFSEEVRHQRRVSKVIAIEQGTLENKPRNDIQRRPK
jgi:ribose 5-phosphate isomerase B